MARDILDLDVGQAILTAYNADGFLGVGVDVPGGQGAGTSPFQAHMPFGIIGRPRDPDQAPDGTPTLGASVLYGYAGNTLHAWPLGDPRAIAKLPQVPKGTWGAYGDTGREELPLMVLDGTTGSFALRVPHSTGGGVASRVLVDVETAGQEEILLAIGGGLEVRVRASATYVGNTATAQNVALAPDLIAFASTAASVIGQLVTAVNALAPGSVTPGSVLNLIAAALKYSGSAPTAQSAVLKAQPISP